MFCCYWRESANYLRLAAAAFALILTKSVLRTDRYRLYLARNCDGFMYLFFMFKYGCHVRAQFRRGRPSRATFYLWLASGLYSAAFTLTSSIPTFICVRFGVVILRCDEVLYLKRGFYFRQLFR